MATPTNIIEPFSKRLNSTAGLWIALFSLVIMGFGAGKYSSAVDYKGEINDLKNKQALEIIKIQKEHSLEIIELQKRLNLLEIINEKKEKQKN